MAIFNFNNSQQPRIGLDIGSRYIKLVQLAPSSNGIQLVNLGICATPIGSVTEGSINNAEAIGEAIWQLMKYYDIKEKRVICSLPGRSVVIRQVSLPTGLNDKDIKSTTINEVERFLPFPPDEMEYDYNVLGETTINDVKQTSVLFIAAHREVVQKRVEAARLAGLESIEIDVDPLVILRSIVESSMYNDQDTFTQTILIIDIGAASTNVSILRAGQLRFTRVFSIGGDALTHAIESGMGYSFLDSEKVKREKGIAFIDDNSSQDFDQDTHTIHSMLKPHLETLSLEIRRSLAYYSSKYRGENVTKILLTGGGSLLKGIARYFEDDLGIPASHANPLANIPYIGSLPIEKVAALVPFLGVATGLSLRQLPPKQLAKSCLHVEIEPSYEFGSASQAAMLA